MRNDLDITYSIMSKLQSVIHDIDELSNSVLYKHDFKQRCDNFYNYMAKRCEGLTLETDVEDAQNFVDIVSKFDTLGNSIKVIKK